MASDCPREVCRCEDWPPDECPQCGVQTLGFTPEDWRQHFDQECRSLARVFCFVADPQEVAES